MEEKKEVKEQNLEEVNGGTANAAFRVKCPYCHSSEHTYLVRTMDITPMKSIKVFLCSACDIEFQQ